MKLDVGCGSSCRQGYFGVDIDPLSGAYFVCNAWEIPIADHLVDEIYARHFWEHLNPCMARKTLVEWKRILRPTGKVRLIFPDLEYHCGQIFWPGKSEFVDAPNFDHALAAFFGWTAGDNPNPFMEHKWGYTRKSLKEFVVSFGFMPIFLPCRACDIDVEMTLAP